MRSRTTEIVPLRGYWRLIYNQNFIWLHLPRTGGTATASWMREFRETLNLAIVVDSDTESTKHDNLLTRSLRKPNELGFLLEQKNIPICINFKRLPDWLRSNYLFIRNLGFDVPAERYRAGEFFSLRMGDWCPADWWINYFEFEKITHIMRCDRLEYDWRTFVRQLTGIEPPQTHFKQLNMVGNPSELSTEWRQCDWRSAYRRNPAWTKIEKSVFGLETDGSSSQA